MRTPGATASGVLISPLSSANLGLILPLRMFLLVSPCELRHCALNPLVDSRRELLAPGGAFVAAIRYASPDSPRAMPGQARVQHLEDSDGRLRVLPQKAKKREVTASIAMTPRIPDIPFSRRRDSPASRNTPPGHRQRCR